MECSQVDNFPFNHSLFYMQERSVLILKLILTHVILPASLTAAVVVVRGDAFLLNAIAQTVTMIIFFSGYWEFFWRGSRIVFFYTNEVNLMMMLGYTIFRSGPVEINIPLVVLLAFIEIIFLAQLIKIFIVILKKDSSSVEIQFPLKKGRFLITDGGNSKMSRLMNYHYYSPVHMKNNTNGSMLFATDIVKRDDAFHSFFPKGNDDYAIFGEAVYSPMDGIIVKVENSIEDNQPYIGTYPYNTGNTIVIKNDDRFFLLGHLKQGSIKVKTGECVKEHQMIGQIGNSGMSERPHLHMQLISCASENYWSGTGINMIFQGKNFYKNRTIKN